MTRLIAIAVAAAFLGLSAGHLPAQHISTNRGFHYSGGHDYWYSHGHAPDVVRLSNYVGELEEVCRHLHEDVHNLSQDYKNSAALEAYIDRLDRLKVHLHEVLSAAASQGIYSSSLDRHVKQDIREAKQLLTDFYALIEDQTYSGTRASDYRMMNHMQEIIVREAFPLVASVEVELYGYELPNRLAAGRVDVHDHAQHGVRVEGARVLRPSWPAPNLPVPPIAGPYVESRVAPVAPPIARGRGSVSIGGFRIRF